MKPWMKWILLATPLMLTQCRSSTVTPIGTVTPHGGGGGGDVNLAHGQGEVAYEPPPHTFSPRPHPPRIRYDAPPPNLAALPKMVQRLDQCYGASKPAVAKSSGSGPLTQTTQTSPAPSPGYKHVPYGGATPTSTSTPAPTTPAKETKPSASAATKAGAGAGRGSAPVAELDAAPMAPPRVTEPISPSGGAPPPSGPADVQAKQKKKRERARDKAEMAASAPSMPEAEAPPMLAGDYDDSVAYVAVEPVDEDAQYGDWGQATYLSNDDTMSLSSAQRVIYAIDKFLPVPLAHIRPHELLNYFSFETAEVAPTDDFSVLAEIAEDPKQEGIYTLALSIRGRPIDKQARRNANVTFVIDRSGSMSDEGRMDYLKRGMRRMIRELKTGDLVSVVLFDHNVCVPLENYVVGRDKPEILEKTIDRLKPRGATDLFAGLMRGYELTDRAYQPTYNNRVILITDALANRGETDPRVMGLVAKYYDERKIRLSGVGVGREFNDALLDKLTERGKGAYVFLGSEAEVDAVFGPRFISLLETTAVDVHFQLHLPPSLRMNVFYGEESSAVKEDVQAIHYFANTSQLFLSDLMARKKKLRPQDQIMLTIEYEDPETGTKMVEERAFTLGEIEREAYNIRKGRLLMAWADRLALLASRPRPAGSGAIAGGWIDADGWQQCEQGKAELRELAQGMDDPEVTRVLSLWDKFCARYERPRNPTRRTPVADQSGWPSAR